MTSQDEKRTARARQLLNRGAALLEEGKVDEAIPFLERALELDRGNVALLIDLGGAYVMGGQHKRAIPLLEAARNTEPENAMIWINLGAAYLGNPILATPEQQEMAILAFETALELNPAAPSVHYNLGLVHLDRDDLERARQAFLQALQINPFDHDASYWLKKLEGQEEGKGGEDEQ
jgi:tetratricopeptide (TPR) repeat protein